MENQNRRLHQAVLIGIGGEENEKKKLVVESLCAGCGAALWRLTRRAEVGGHSSPTKLVGVCNALREQIWCDEDHNQRWTEECSGFTPLDGGQGLLDRLVAARPAAAPVAVDDKREGDGFAGMPEFSR